MNIDIRYAPAGETALILAKELIALRPEVIVAHAAQVTGALHKETRTIPVVFVNVSDPIGAGFVASLARPGGNLTGVLTMRWVWSENGWRCSRRLRRV